MKTELTTLSIFICTFIFISWYNPQEHWLRQKQNRYILQYCVEDKLNAKEYASYIEKGMLSVTQFFGTSFPKEFTVYVHPNRNSLDSTWRKDWNMPDFKSQCWMVASGIATKLDLISPKVWDQQSCEHKYAESEKTQQLITHELVHVYHGQLNVSPDFSTTEGLDWFVEGLATYASGQCDSNRIADVKKALKENKIPPSLDNFWSGKIKYGLSGSVVMYIDSKFGRKKLNELLPLAKKSELLSALTTSEEDLLNEWKIYLQKL